MSERRIEILDEVKGVKVTAHDREYDTPDGGNDETVWDYYSLADGRRCVYRNGFFWEWLED